MDESQDNLKQYFIDKVRDNLHVMVCMSPMNAKFPIRARKFPGIVSCPTIDWFLPWPADALVALSKAFIQNFHVECTPEVKTSLMTHMGMVHSMVTEVCEEYFTKMRRRVFQTPKSYLSFIQNFTTLYSGKLAELKVKEGRVNLGLQKLIQVKFMYMYFSFCGIFFYLLFSWHFIIILRSFTYAFVAFLYHCVLYMHIYNFGLYFSYGEYFLFNLTLSCIKVNPWLSLSGSSRR